METGSLVREMAAQGRAMMFESLARKQERIAAEGRHYTIVEELGDLWGLGLTQDRTRELMLEAARRRIGEVSLSWLATYGRDWTPGLDGLTRTVVANVQGWLTRVVVGSGRSDRAVLSAAIPYGELGDAFREGETRLRVIERPLPKDLMFRAAIRGPAPTPPATFKIVDDKGHLESRLSLVDAFAILRECGAEVCTTTRKRRHLMDAGVPDPFRVVEVRALELGHVKLPKGDK